MPCRVPSASRHVTPAGPTSVPPPWPQMVLAVTAAANGPSESPTTAAASVSAVLPAAPAYIPPTRSTALPASSVANCERPCGNSAAPGAHAPVTKPEIRLVGAVSLVASRAGLAPRPPPGGTLSETPPNATTRSSRTTPPPYARGPGSPGAVYQPSMCPLTSMRPTKTVWRGRPAESVPPITYTRPRRTTAMAPATGAGSGSIVTKGVSTPALDASTANTVLWGTPAESIPPMTYSTVTGSREL